MKNFRSFITEAKNASAPVFTNEQPVEDRIDTVLRHVVYDQKMAHIYGKPAPSANEFPDREMPYQRITHGGKTIAKGYVDKVPYFQTFASSSKNMSPSNKKFTVISHHKVYGEGYPGNPDAPVVKRLTTVMAPSGKHYIFSSHSDTGGTYGQWHMPNGEEMTSMDAHNHFRIHEPTMFPTKKVNDHYYDIKTDSAERNRHLNRLSHLNIQIGIMYTRQLETH